MGNSRSTSAAEQPTAPSDRYRTIPTLEDALLLYDAEVLQAWIQADLWVELPDVQ